MRRRETNKAKSPPLKTKNSRQPCKKTRQLNKQATPKAVCFLLHKTPPPSEAKQRRSSRGTEHPLHRRCGLR
ncbi:hypothetical protein XA68_13459 [Ophiocordyceps unilateralis]|uniref:Uncharacterized protein n=1 Tax=Ophiocordyceps unilateralis TaxID=268505 RepID=A0A2A9PB14_OPHUN|nr:hypothetical protein XA68_13459 [Ophiocordyceps unilateralis]